MKRIISLILIVALVFSFTACGEKTAIVDPAQPIQTDEPKKQPEENQEITSQESSNKDIFELPPVNSGNLDNEDKEKVVSTEAVSEPVHDPKVSEASKIISHYVSADVLNKSAEYVYSKVQEPSIGSIGGEWAVIGLKKSGYKVADDYFDKYYKVCSDNVASVNGVLHERKYTEYSRTALCLSLIGKDPTNVEGFNLIEPLNDFDKTVWQGNNGSIWALIAIDANNTECSKRNAYISEIVNKQLDNGGWSISGDTVDMDVTAMALTALSNYSKQDKVKAAIEKGFKYIEDSYAASGFEFSETYSQCITAYAANNRNLPAGMFDDFISFRQSNGGFLHIKGDAVNQMASEQGLYALTALYRAENGMGKLFKF